MSGFNERMRALFNAFDRTESPEILREIHELEFQKRKAEDAAEREQRERAAVAERERRERAVAEKQRVASTDWYAAVDTRIRTHFKDWAWAAIDERIQ
jgi:transcription elongation GreA/GreB family factor